MRHAGRPANTQLTAWPDTLPKWDSLSLLQKKLYAREAEVFAGYAAYTDNEIGRVIQAVEDMGKLDNTLIIYISGDNGTSAEGTLEGTPNQMTAYNGILKLPEAELMLHYEDWGSDKTYPHMSVAWSWAFDTPFKWTKQVASHFGGTRQGMAISWPGHIKDVGGIRSQFHHIIDIVPTILEATGIQAPATVNGIAQKPIEGVSMAYTFDQANANAPSKRDTQYFEMFANRGIYHDGWYACTTPPAPPWLMGTAKLPDVNDYKWELYNIAEDYSQYNDLAAKNPDKLKELQALFLTEAAKYQVLPLDNSVLPRLITPRPSATAGRTEFTYKGVNPGIPVGNAPSIMNKDYKITAEITVPKGGAEGMIVTLGGRFGGYGLYLLKGKPVFVYNMLDLKRYRWEAGVGARGLVGFCAQAGQAHHRVRLQIRRARLRQGRHRRALGGWQGSCPPDRSRTRFAFLMAIDESFDIGIDTRTGVDDSYKLPFQFTGKIDKLTFKLGPTQLSSDEQRIIQHARAKASD